MADVLNTITPRGGELAITSAEKLIEEGILRGLWQGMQQGVREGLLEGIERIIRIPWLPKKNLTYLHECYKQNYFGEHL
jgi:hypothetical protein